MLFNSSSFAVFFPIVTIGYFPLPYRLRWLWLLAASCVSYMAFIPAYILIPAFTIFVDDFAGLLIAPAEGRRGGSSSFSRRHIFRRRFFSQRTSATRPPLSTCDVVVPPW